MSPVDGYVYKTQIGVYEASYYGRALGAFSTEEAAMDAVQEVNEGRPVWLVGYGVESRQLA